MSKRKFVEDEETFVEPVVEETPVEEVVEETVPVEPITGKVANCALLNIRNKPRTDSEVLCVLDCGAELMIDAEKSTDEWYAVCTTVGLEGFCMKEFVEIK